MFWTLLECKAGSGTPLYLMMQKRQEAEVTKLSQNNLFFSTVCLLTPQSRIVPDLVHQQLQLLVCSYDQCSIQSGNLPVAVE